MVGSKTVLVCCGTGIATSTMVATGLKEALADRGIAVETRQCTAAEVRGRLGGVDVIVTTTPLSDDLGVPVVQGLAFLTGVGKDAVIDRVAGILTG